MNLIEERSPAGAPGLAYRRLGDGPPLLLVNGYAATKDDWDPSFLNSLGASSTVISPDNRGVGESDRGESAITIDSMADDLVALLDRLDLDQVDVVGWSMGGFISQTLASQYPERVRSLALLGTDPGGGLSKLTEPKNWFQLIDKTGTPEEQAERLINLLFPHPFSDQVLSVAGQLVAAARASLDPEVLAEQEQAMAGWQMLAEPLLAQIVVSNPRLPILISHGTEDQIIPAENSRIMSELSPAAWYAPFSGGGHAFMAQEPDRLGGLISRFLNR